MKSEMYGADYLGGATADDVMDRMEKIASMSAAERSKYIRSAVQKAKKAKLSENDAAMIMGADGYFQNDDGEYN